MVFLFPVLQVFGIPNSPRSLDLDDRQGFIASSAMQQKKKILFGSLVSNAFFFGSLLLGSSPGRSALQSAE